jgi:hypothetical protein
MEASFKNARALRLRFSQSLARRRQRLSHAMVRSTIQRLGNHEPPGMIGTFNDFGFEARQDFGERLGKKRPLIGAIGREAVLEPANLLGRRYMQKTFRNPNAIGDHHAFEFISLISS